MSYVLPLQLTQDAPTTQAGTLLCPGARRLLLTVRTPASTVPGSNGAGSVWYELGQGTGGAPQWEGVKRLVPPGTLGRGISCDAIRVWSAAPGVPQYVQIEADV